MYGPPPDLGFQILGRKVLLCSPELPSGEKPSGIVGNAIPPELEMSYRQRGKRKSPPNSK